MKELLLKKAIDKVNLQFMKMTYNNFKNAYDALKQKGIKYIFFGSFFRNVIMYIITLVLSYIVKKDDYGQLSLAENISNIIMIINGYGAVEAYLQYSSRVHDDNRRFLLVKTIKKYIKYELLLTFVGIVVALFYINDKKMFDMLLIYAFLPPVSFLSELFYSYIRAGLRNKEYAYFSLLQAVIVVVFELSLFFAIGLIGIVLGKVLAICLQTIFLYKKIIYTDIQESNSEGDIKIGSDFVKYGVYYIFAQLTLKIGPYLELQFSNNLHNISNVAIYKVAAIIPTGLLFIPSSIAVFYYPIVAKNCENKEWQKRNVKRIVYYTLLLCSLIGVFMFSFSEIIIQTLYKGKYYDSIILMKIMSLSFIINGGIRVSTSNIILALGHAEFNLKRGIITMLIQIPLNLFFSFKYALPGLAFSVLFVNIASGFMNCIYLYNNLYKREI